MRWLLLDNIVREYWASWHMNKTNLFILFPVLFGIHSFAQQPSTPDAKAGSAKQLKLECRLLEMSSLQADVLETRILQSNGTPSVSSGGLDKILLGCYPKVLSNLTLALESGKRNAVKQNIKDVEMRTLVLKVLKGVNPNLVSGAGVRSTGDSLEAEAILGADGTICDLNLVFQKVEVHKSQSFGREKVSTGFSLLNGLPVVLGRSDSGGISNVMVAQGTWPQTTSSTWPKIFRPYIRAQIFTVPQMVDADATKLKDDPKALAAWLRQRGTYSGVLGVISASGKRSTFEHVEELPFRTGGDGGNGIEWLNYGSSLEAEIIMGATGQLSVNASLKSAPYDKPAPTTEVNAEKEILKCKVNFTCGLGEALAFPCDKVDTVNTVSGTVSKFVLFQVFDLGSPLAAPKPLGKP